MQLALFDKNNGYRRLLKLQSLACLTQECLELKGKTSKEICDEGGFCNPVIEPGHGDHPFDFKVRTFIFHLNPFRSFRIYLRNLFNSLQRIVMK